MKFSKAGSKFCYNHLALLLCDGWLQRSYDSFIKDVLELRTVMPIFEQDRWGRTPFCVSAEHSTNLTAPNSLAKRSPCSDPIGFSFCLANFSRTVGSSRKSTWVPTIKQGTPGQ